MGEGEMRLVDGFQTPEFYCIDEVGLLLRPNEHPENAFFFSFQISLRSLILYHSKYTYHNRPMTMKKILFTLLAVFTISLAHGQKITNGSYNTTGHIKSDGTIQNSSYSTKGHIKSDGTIQNASYSTIGHIKSDGTIQDGSYRTVGYVKKDGTVQNSSYSTIGHIKDDGTVQNSSYSTIGHAKGVKKEWAAVVFFFFKFD
jgi:hypothetical protein